MPPGKPHKHHNRDHLEHDREHGRAMNTPENALKAVATARASLLSLRPGRTWRHHAPHGEFEIKGSLVLNDMAVVVLHFSPEDGSLLPKGLHGISEGRPEVFSVVEARLGEIPPRLAVLEGAEYREPESCWSVPLAYEGRIVGHIKVSSDGTTILSDKKAANGP